MLCTVGHLGLDDFEMFISVFPYYTEYIPTVSTKSMPYHDGKKLHTDRTKTYISMLSA